MVPLTLGEAPGTACPLHFGLADRPARLHDSGNALVQSRRMEPLHRGLAGCAASRRADRLTPCHMVTSPGRPWHEWAPSLARTRARRLGLASLWERCCKLVHSWAGRLASGHSSAPERTRVTAGPVAAEALSITSPLSWGRCGQPRQRTEPGGSWVITACFVQLAAAWWKLRRRRRRRLSHVGQSACSPWPSAPLARFSCPGRVRWTSALFACAASGAPRAWPCP